jgi:AraC family transcriptional regulator
MRREVRPTAPEAPGCSSVVPLPVEDISRLIPVETVATSGDRGWRGVRSNRFRYATEGFYLPGFKGHAVVVHLGPAAELAERAEGRLHKALVRKGDVSIVPAGLESEWWWADGKKVDRVHTYLDPALLRETASEAGADPDRVEVLNSVAVRDPFLERVGMALLEEIASGGLAGRLYAESLASVLAVHLLRNHSSLGRGASRSLNPERAGRLPEASLRAAQDYVDDNLSGDLSLAEIAAAAHLSPFHFARAFKRSTGLSPHQYVMRRRIERARELLVGTELSVGVVARRVGFSSPSHFTQQFRRIVGLAPSAFR